MVAIVYKCRTPFSWNDWDQKKKLLVILMMLMDEEDSVMLKRRIWCRQWLLYDVTNEELAIEDTPGFAEHMRMPYAKFVELAEKIFPFIVKQETCMRKSILTQAKGWPLQLGILPQGKLSNHSPSSFGSERRQYLRL